MQAAAIDLVVLEMMFPGEDSIKEPLNKLEFVGSVVLTVDFADMSFQNSD
jgi:hypothetical protein